MATGEALICKLKNLEPIDGADKIQKSTMFGETLIISKDYKEGDLGLLFDCETLLSEDFCKNNNLFRHPELNKDKNKKGFFDDNRRVRPIRLLKTKVSGFWIPIESLSYISKYLPDKEGVQLNEFEGKKICEKYTRPIRQNHKQNKPAKRIQQVLYFSEVNDTDQLLRNLNKLNIEDKIIVTTKIHGCSLRVGLLPCTPRGRFKQWLYKLLNIRNTFRFVVGSRHVLKYCEGMKIDKKDSFYEEDIWTKAAFENFKDKLLPGEEFFAEICGFLPSGAAIMPSHSNEKLKNFLDKDEYEQFIKKFGNETVFSYGCSPDNPNKHYKVFIYGGCLTTENGLQIHYSWSQLKRRAEEMGISTVPELFSIYIEDESDKIYWTNDQYWSTLTENDCKFFPNHLNEGIVVKIENSNLKPITLKHKKFAFKVLEGIIKDEAEFADMEESN